jgi:hypothetical protein
MCLIIHMVEFSTNRLTFLLSTSIGCVAKSFLFCPKLDIAEHTTNGISSIQFLLSHVGDGSGTVSSLRAC